MPQARDFLYLSILYYIIPMKKQILILFLILTPIVLTAQKAEYITKTDIPYYDHTVNKKDSYITERCVLDIYYPKDSKGFGTIIWFHGGGITEGNKEIPEALKNKGYCIIGVNYRLSPRVTAPAYIEDAAAAIAWVFKNIESYGGNTSKIFVTGYSAGGYLAMMTGLDKKYLEKHNIDANSIAALISFSGQCITHATVRKESNISDKQPTVDKYAPLFHVRADAPPLLLITGDRELEILGRYEETAYLARMMKISGHNDTRLLELDGYDHGMTEPAFPLLLKEVKRVLDSKK